MYSRDEGLNEANISKPRIFIQNASNVAISQFTLHYYFVTEDNKTPVLDQYYVPGSVVTLHQVQDSLYEVQYYFEGELVAGGAILPDQSGNVIGLHYPDYSAWDKTNDFSFPNSDTFVRNGNITVTDNSGNLIYGTMP